MAAAAQALVEPYVPDTVVVDTEDLQVHVKLLDEDGRVRWHRKMAETAGLLTACDEDIDYDLVLEQRVERYEGELCKAGCFSASELARAAATNARSLDR
jgi:hypothetical protein